VSEYFELWDDKLVTGRWHLQAPHVGDQWVNADLFTGGGGPVAPPETMVIKRPYPGVALDYTMASRGLPVASERAAHVFERSAADDVQLIPVTVEGHREPYFIVHALHALECVDEQRSEGIRPWTEADERPDRLGDYKAIDALRIDPARVAGHHLFRVKRWEVALIVSAHLREELERAGLTGLRFVPA